jgi:hypothetical protein
MGTLPKLTLKYNSKSLRWELIEDVTRRIRTTFASKAAATAAGALERAVGPEGGSVKIMTQDGRFEEERTYPRARDPRRSPG